jgi:alkanesulfonate monooxygenase SsuD/methylene tetrahydromethanopterin reductase-like flavin-dependent oxidoreductase (luciferase family)
MTRFGVQVSTAMCTMAEIRDAWARVEAMGYEWISGQDHFTTLRGAGASCFEALTTHAALAACTTTARVGCLVYSAGYRHPAVMANALVTVDHLSDGRLEVGMGAGWLQAEYEQYGLEFEPPAVRLRRLRESVTVIRALWSNETTDFDGEFFHLRDARCDPDPVQQLPPIWIGAKGPRALAVAAEVGDGWNANFIPAHEFAAGVEIVRGLAADPARFGVAASVPFVSAADADVDAVIDARYGAAADTVRAATLAGSVGRLTDGVGRFAAAGADWLILAVRPPFEFDALERFATDVAPRFR